MSFRRLSERGGKENRALIKGTPEAPRPKVGEKRIRRQTANNAILQSNWVIIVKEEKKLNWANRLAPSTKGLEKLTGLPNA